MAIEHWSSVAINRAVLTHGEIGKTSYFVARTFVKYASPYGDTPYKSHMIA